MKIADLAINRISEKGIPEGVVGATSLMSFHLLQEWESLNTEPEPEAKLVSSSPVGCETYLEKRCRGRQDLMSEEGKSELISDLRAYVSFIRMEHASPSDSKAKYTDEYPTLSAASLKLLLDQENQCAPNPWLRHTDFIELDRKRQPKLKTSVESVYRLLVDLVTTFILYGYDTERQLIIARLNRVFCQWLRLLKELKFNFIKLAKYKLAAFAAYAKQSSMMPKSPFSEEFISINAYSKPKFIFDAMFDRFLEKQMKRQDTTTERLYFMSLVDTICRGIKKGSDRPTDEDVHVANLSTVECFSAGPFEGRDYTDHNEPYFPETVFSELRRIGGRLVEVSWDGQNGICPNPDDEVLRTVDEIVPPDSKDYCPTWHRMPSLSACYENIYARAGSSLSVKNQLEGGVFDPNRKPQLPDKSDRFKIVLPDVMKPQELHRLYGGVKNGIFSDFQCDPEISSDPAVERLISYDLLDASFNRCGDYLELSGNYDGLSDPNDIEKIVHDLVERHNSGNGIDGRPHMTVVGLKEALKVRGITKGEAMENWLLQPLQKYLAARLLKFKCFSATGRPLVAEDLNQIFRHMEAGTKFLSGDYDNATNKMYSHYTELALRRVCANLDLSSDWTELAVNSLCNNIVEYHYFDPLTKKIVSIVKVQKNAQPMGKILSFVILCIINAAVCRKAVEVDSGNRFYRVKLKHFRGLVNGDDCCFALRNFESWTRMSNCVGLENSIGKTFFSDQFIEMNSRSFVIDVSSQDYLVFPSGERSNIRFIETPFVNFGLMKGLVRSTSQASEHLRFERFCCLGDCHTDMISGVEFLYGPLDFMFKRFNRDLLLDHRLDGIPYYVPKQWGGLGLHPGPEPWRTISTEHRQIMQMIVSDSLKPAYVGNARTCLVHEKINDILDELMETVGLSKTEATSIQIDNGDVLSLKTENQKVYTDLMERVWKTSSIHDLKVDIEEDAFELPKWARDMATSLSMSIESKSDIQILINRRQIFSKISRNRKIWKNCYQSIPHRPQIRPLPWARTWLGPKKTYYPVVKADAVRDMRLRIAEF